MHVPRRPLTRIQPLPSIYTVFSNHYDRINSGPTSDGSNSARFEDGLEVVPLERDSRLSAPILNPWQVEKEVYLVSQEEWSEKPLPSPPRSPWKRMSLKCRVISLLGLQATILLTIGLALLTISKHHPLSENSSEIREAGGDLPIRDSADRIRRGTFALPIESAQQQSSTCLLQINDSRAWQCMLDTNLQLNILPSSANDLKKTLITLGLATGVDNTVHSGHQAPEILPTELTTVIDLENMTSYHFQTTYNHTVLLRDYQLEPETAPEAQGQASHTLFQPGDSLWRCTFEETQLEGYINVDVNSTASSDTSVPSRNSTTTQLPRMPYSLKLVEQTISRDNPAYCEKVEVSPTRELLARAGERTVLKLAEPTSSSSNDNSCRCQWAVPSAA